MSGEVIDIQRARSYSPPTGNRWVDRRVIMDHFSLSEKTISNYMQGFYIKNKEKHFYKSAMPHLRLPGGGVRFNLRECEDWLKTGVHPV